MGDYRGQEGRTGVEVRTGATYGRGRRHDAHFSGSRRARRTRRAEGRDRGARSPAALRASGGRHRPRDRVGRDGEGCADRQRWSKRRRGVGLASVTGTAAARGL